MNVFLESIGVAACLTSLSLLFVETIGATASFAIAKPLIRALFKS
jgi:hypothetical protein